MSDGAIKSFIDAVFILAGVYIVSLTPLGGDPILRAIGIVLVALSVWRLVGRSINNYKDSQSE